MFIQHKHPYIQYMCIVYISNIFYIAVYVVYILFLSTLGFLLTVLRLFPTISIIHHTQNQYQKNLTISLRYKPIRGATVISLVVTGKQPCHPSLFPWHLSFISVGDQTNWTLEFDQGVLTTCMFSIYNRSTEEAIGCVACKAMQHTIWCSIRKKGRNAAVGGFEHSWHAHLSQITAFLYTTW